MAAKCKMCKKSVYPMDPQINLDGSIFHKPCAKCGDCNCQITISNFTKNESPDETVLLCKIHYFKRFHEGGSYLGGEKYHKTATRDAEKRPSILVPEKEAPIVYERKPVETVFKKLSVTESSTSVVAQEPVAIEKLDTKESAIPEAEDVIHTTETEVVVAQADAEKEVTEPVTEESTQEEHSTEEGEKVSNEEY